MSIEEEKKNLTDMTAQAAEALEGVVPKDGSIGFVVVLTRHAMGGGVLSATMSNLSHEAFKRVIGDALSVVEDEEETLH